MCLDRPLTAAWKRTSSAKSAMSETVLLAQDLMRAADHPLINRLLPSEIVLLADNNSHSKNTSGRQTDVAGQPPLSVAAPQVMCCAIFLITRGVSAACWCWAYRTLRNWVASLG